MMIRTRSLPVHHFVGFGGLRIYLFFRLELQNGSEPNKCTEDEVGTEFSTLQAICGTAPSDQESVCVHVCVLCSSSSWFCSDLLQPMAFLHVHHPLVVVFMLWLAAVGEELRTHVLL